MFNWVTSAYSKQDCLFALMRGSEQHWYWLQETEVQNLAKEMHGKPIKPTCPNGQLVYGWCWFLHHRPNYILYAHRPLPIHLWFLIMYRTYSRWTNYSNPASMSCRITPAPQISTLWFRIFVLDLRFWFVSSIRTSETNQKNNIEIGGAGGYWITRVWIIRPSTVRGAVVSRSAENVTGNFS